MAIGGYESWVRDERVLEQIEKYKQDMDVLHEMLSAPGDLDKTVGNLYRSDRYAAEVIDDIVGPDLEFNPASSDQRVLAASPDLRRDDSIAKVLEILEDDTTIAEEKNRRLLEIATDRLEAVGEELKAMRDRGEPAAIEAAASQRRRRERWRRRPPRKTGDGRTLRAKSTPPFPCGFRSGCKPSGDWRRPAKQPICSGYERRGV